MSSFVSDLQGIPLIREDLAAEFEKTLDNNGEFGRGWQPRPAEEDPSLFGFCTPLSIPPIDRSEWDERIKDLQQQKNRLTDLADMLVIPIRSQMRTNYCWMWAVIRAFDLLRAQQGFEHVPLSPASCAAPITNYANARGNPAGVGGWSTRGLKYLAEVGAAPVSLWSDTAIDRSLDTPAVRAIRSQYRCREWWDLKGNNFDQMATVLLTGKPVAGGLMWMGHAMCAVDLVKLDGRGRYGVVWDNSYGPNWGKNGRVVFEENRSTAADQVAPRVAVAA
jgi:hypothetical protein